MNNRLIVVLGMHRSGTSAIARGLQVMGVTLGETLYGAMYGVNDKGFWEDIHLNTLNAEMLDALESDWSYVSTIDSDEVKFLHKQGFFVRAVELLREKISSSSVFAFKDPRVAKLLPFWKEVFAYGQFNVSYVLAVRHPISVARSLEKRDGLFAEQSYLLWLSYVITSLTFSAGNKRALVDYDCLMQSPEHELKMIAKNLELEVDPIELQDYKTEFLDQSLRHTFYDLNDLLLDETCPALVEEIYCTLLNVRSDSSDAVLSNKVEQWSDELERLKPMLRLVDKLIKRNIVVDQAILERDDAILEREENILKLNKVILERDEKITQIINSKSWKLTKPLRFCTRIVRSAIDSIKI